MKRKIFFLVFLVGVMTCFLMQSCNSEESNTMLSEEEKIAEMFRQAGFEVEKLSEPVNTPMTEEEALFFLEAYKKRERSGSIQIPANNIEKKSDGSFVVRVKHNPRQKNFSRTRTDSTEEFEFSHWTDFTEREIHIECYQEKNGAKCWRSKNVNCNVTLKNYLYRSDVNIDPDCGYSSSSLKFKIDVHIYQNSGWYNYSFDDNYEYTLTLAWAEQAGEWVGSLSWYETSW